MKKFLALLAATALVFGALAGCNPNEKATVPPVSTEVPEVNATLKPEETKKAEKPANENKHEVPLSAPTKAFIAPVKVDKEEVKKTVLAHAGLNEAEVKLYKTELDKERDRLVYEVEFDAGKYEYDYEVDAETGKVLKAEKEFRD